MSFFIQVQKIHYISDLPDRKNLNKSLFLKPIVSQLEALLEKTKNRKVVIAVLGLGRVGLPLASVYGTKGIRVIGVDINQKRVEAVNKGICPFYDPPLQETLEKAVKAGNLTAVTTLDEIKENLDVIFVTVGTPTVDNNVDYSQLNAALDQISTINIKGKMIILRSTMPPSTTTDFIMPFLESKSEIKAGQDFGLAVCPERILEGQAIREIHELPEIIGGVNKMSNDIATELFLIINPKKDILYTTPTGAELGKLFANIFRYISFSLANEFAIWSEKYGLDASELIRIVNYNYPRAKIPIPGFVGGPCLSKDGMFLDANTTFSSIISSAWKLNESIPQYVVNSIKKYSGNLFNKKISVLGYSFKAGSDDTRNSPSVKLVDILKSSGAQVMVHDPYVKSTQDLSEVLKSTDIVILATNHKEFKDITPKIRASGCKIVYDVWSVYKKEEFPDIKYIRFGEGIS